MPKILTSYLIDEWTYGWRAHRQGHTSGVETTESTKLLEELGVVGKSVYVVRTPVHQISNLFFPKSILLFGFQGSHLALATWAWSRLSSHCCRELPTLF